MEDASSSVTAGEGVRDHPLASPPEGSGANGNSSKRPAADYSNASDPLRTQASTFDSSGGLGISGAASSNPFSNNAAVTIIPSTSQDGDLGGMRSPSSEEHPEAEGGLSRYGRRGGNYSAVSDFSEGVYDHEGAQGPAASTDRLTPLPGSDHDTRSNGKDGSGVYGNGGSALGRFASLRKSQSRQQAPREPLTPEEEDSQHVQMNLERWAAEERQRRRALRSSRANSQHISQGGSSGSSSSLSRNLSITLADRSNGAPLKSLLRTSLGTESFSSLESMQEGSNRSNVAANGNASPYANGNGEHGSASAGQGRSSGGSPPSPVSTLESSRDLKGKGRAVENPFNDPADGDGHDADGRTYHASNLRGDYGPAPSNKPRPTAKYPIVTVGGVPRVRRHLGPGVAPDGRTLPSIVSTDADAVLSSSSSSSPGRGKYDMKRGGGSYGKASKPGTIDEDREEEDRQNAKNTAGGAPRRIGELAPPIRKSTSESRFNEIDLDLSEEDEEEAAGMESQARDEAGSGGTARARHGFTQDSDSRPAGAHEEGRRVAWWTEWLFCCGGPPPDDEQTGRTNPLE